MFCNVPVGGEFSKEEEEEEAAGSTQASSESIHI
jgi:hypothetical protein